jgi:alpha-glucoside transport system substrate-binding protein
MKMSSRTRAIALLATSALATVGLAACGGSEAADGGPVTIWMSLDETTVAGLTKTINAKAEKAGIEVKIERVDGIDQLVKTRIQAGDPPDIALVPQPGVVKSIVDLGAAYPLDDVLDMEALEQSMVPGTLDAGRVDGDLYGLMASMNVKSLLFYPKKAFEAAGYQEPESLDELTALADQIRADGGAPWCLTMESGGATGWLATDWFEDLIMRIGSPEEYQQWVDHEIPFDSDLVKEAAAEFEELLFTEGNVLGGREAIASTNFGNAANPMFKAEPDCWMYKQGSFMTGFFTESAGVQDLDKEVGVFGFPPVEEGGDNPVLGGGDMALAMSDDEATAQVMEWLADPEIGNEAAPNSSFISPHTTFDASLYPTDLTRQMADVAYNSTAFLFDGSDQMPGEVGAGSFWREITAWISGETDLDTALQNIDESWPS